MVQCEAIAKSSGRRCTRSPLDGKVFCKFHDQSRPVCRGMTKEDRPCRALALEKFDYKFCRLSHVPGYESTPPEDFRVPNLHHEMRSIVNEFRGHKDVCTNKVLQPHARKELDHVVEIHVVRDFDKVKKQGTNFRTRKEDLKEAIKEAVNKVENLNFTLHEINMVKFQGFDDFQKDYREGNNRELGFVPYLKNANFDDRTLSRSETAAIQREVIRSYEAMEDSLQHENALHETFLYHLNKNFVNMRLHLDYILAMSHPPMSIFALVIFP